MPTCVSTNSSTAIAQRLQRRAVPARRLRSRRSRAVWRPAAFCSSAVGLRPVRPRASIEPAALPRCLVRLLRFVWAIAPTRVDDLRAVSGRGAGRLRGSPRARLAGRARRARRRSRARGARTAATTCAAVTLVWSSMLVETWTALLSWRPRARTSSVVLEVLARSPSPVSRVASISTLNATSGGRAATSVAPAVGCALRAEVGLEVVEAAGSSQLRARPPAGELAVEVDGDAELPELVGEDQRLGARGASSGPRSR